MRMISRFCPVFLSTMLICNMSVAESQNLEIALQNTYIACADIDDDLMDMKKMAGINTAVTGVGTGLGIGATATGLAKVSVDKAADELEAELQEEIRKLEELAKTQTEIDFIPDLATMRKNGQKAVANSGASDSEIMARQDAIDQKQAELDALNKKSKKLGNWRTGLMVGNTATNVAGTIIASKNRVDENLQSKIDACVQKVKELSSAITAARINGEDVNEAQQIYNACREYEYVDLSPIDKRAKGAMISSAAGVGTGVLGVITSAVANTDKVRNDNSQTGHQKEKNLNTASNVLAGTSTVASGVATVFNASQIAAIKKVASVSEKCTGVLK